ncbi:MAG TPA: hypothetical protein VGP55_03225 [Chitinophagaceae bacterium]|nr:hypothetical protein [Chitinophagaceae bacterium]
MAKATQNWNTNPRPKDRGNFIKLQFINDSTIELMKLQVTVD